MAGLNSRVKCVAAKLSDTNLNGCNKYLEFVSDVDYDFSVNIGDDYPLLGIRFLNNGLIFVYVLNDGVADIFPAPLFDMRKIFLHGGFSLNSFGNGFEFLTEMIVYRENWFELYLEDDEDICRMMDEINRVQRNSF